jgi:RimJ/RimL family protein N-acetyltransferase
MIANDRRIARNLTSAFPSPYTVEDARSFLASGDGAMAIDSTEAVGDLEPGLIGVIGGHRRGGEDDDVFTFGYWLAVEAWGRGFATEAGRAFLDHLIAAESPRRIEAGVFGWNPASANVLEKLGFKLEGRMESRVRRFGEVTDELWFAWLPESECRGTEQQPSPPASGSRSAARQDHPS